MLEKDAVRQDSQEEDDDEDYLVEMLRKTATLQPLDPGNANKEESETDSGSQGSEHKAAPPESEAEGSEAKVPEGRASGVTKASDVNTKVGKE